MKTQAGVGMGMRVGGPGLLSTLPLGSFSL